MQIDPEREQERQLFRAERARLFRLAETRRQALEYVARYEQLSPAGALVVGSALGRVIDVKA